MGVSDDVPRVALLVFGETSVPPLAEGNYVTILWSSVGTEGANPDAVSLPTEIQKHEEALRAAYLAWVLRVGNFPVAGSNVEQRLAIRSDLSYWWMTLPAQFPFWEDSPVPGMIKMFALAEVCHRNNINVIRAVGGSAVLREALARWCRNTGKSLHFVDSLEPLSIQRRWVLRMRNRAIKYTRHSAFAVRANIGSIVRAIGSLVLGLASSLLQPMWRDDPSTSVEREARGVTFIDYVGQGEVDSMASGRFTSRYWGPLVDLVASQRDSTWLHRRVDGVRCCPPTGGPTGASHLDVTHSPSTKHRTRGALDLMLVALKSIRISSQPGIFVDPETGVDAWPLVRKTWAQAFFGANGLATLTWLRSIESDLKSIKFQENAVLLYENQPWELCLMSAWRRHCNRPLVGFAHTTIRFWDLRYAIPGMALGIPSDLCPVPDLIAVNGPAARKAARGFGIPDDRLVDVEAVRYLSEIPGYPRVPIKSRSLGSPLRVLLLGEYDSNAFQRQLHFINTVYDPPVGDVTFVVRPHPAQRSFMSPSSSFALCPPSSSLAECIEQCDGVLVGETSSVVLEALNSGLPLAIMADSMMLPTNPISAWSSNFTLSTPADLRKWLESLLQNPHALVPSVSPKDYYFLDPDLPRWAEVLGLKKN